MTITYDVADAVATITLNRPDSLNSLTREMKLELLAALERAAADADVRAVLLTGAGRAFCAGQDLREHGNALAAGGGLDDTVRRHYNPIVRTLTGMGKPTVAAVNGVAAGAGAGLAFACDLRVAAEEARFVMAFAGVGLGPDTGVTGSPQHAPLAVAAVKQVEQAGVHRVGQFEHDGPCGIGTDLEPSRATPEPTDGGEQGRSTDGLPSHGG